LPLLIAGLIIEPHVLGNKAIQNEVGGQAEQEAGPCQDADCGKSEIYTQFGRLQTVVVPVSSSYGDMLGG
jgi:hypothetical protein